MADVFSPKERLARRLGGQGTERPPVVCPGGMMNAAVTDVMERGGRTLPEAHHEGALMAELAEDVCTLTGFENFGIPFCMTIEAEALGSGVDYGSLKCEPKIAREAFLHVSETGSFNKDAVGRSKRGRAVIEAAAALAKRNPDIPVIGSITGPVSTAASLVDPMNFLKELYRDKENSHRFLAQLTEQLVDWALLLADNGAAAVCIADPTATGEILGPRLFEDYALPYLNRIVQAVHGAGKPVILHICGDVKTVKKHLLSLRSDALSVDAMVNLALIKEENREITTMGNLSTYLLQTGTPEKIRRSALLLLENNIDIIAPACGLSTSSPLENIRAFTGAVKESGRA
jgi:[methyl-Co(III) methanol-specific corrinoid protein]:coenzyme M methyltransferase